MKNIIFIEAFIGVLLSIGAIYSLMPSTALSFILFALWVSAPFITVLFFNISNNNKIGLLVGTFLSILIGIIFYLDIKFWNPDPQGGLVILFLPVLSVIIIILAVSFIKLKKT